MTTLTTTAREQLFAAIRSGWRADTSAATDWSPATPSLGQCAVTALVVQDKLGGKLLRCTVSGVSHYWTVLPGGEEIDLTRDQFEHFRPDSEVEERSRGYILGFLDTGRRYRILAERVEAELRLAELV